MSELLQARKLLVRSTNWLGDAVITLPALREIRRAFASADISILAKPAVAAVFERERLADRVIVYRENWRRTAIALRAERFDAAVLLQNAFEAALIAWWARIPVRCGYARDARSWLLTKAVPVPLPGETPPHECYYYLELLRRLGMIERLPVVNDITFNNAPSRDAGRARLADIGIPASFGGPVIGMSPGAAFGTAKRWFPERYAAAGAAFARQGARVVLFGTAAERALAEEIAAQIGPAAVVAAGRTSLADFIEMVAGCDLYLTNDSGGMHVAAAAGVPTLAVFGSTDHTGTAPLGLRARIVRHPVDCSPCKLRECPIDHRCMSRVEVEDVLKTAQEMLAAPVIR